MAARDAGPRRGATDPRGRRRADAEVRQRQTAARAGLDRRLRHGGPVASDPHGDACRRVGSQTGADGVRRGQDAPHSQAEEQRRARAPAPEPRAAGGAPLSPTISTSHGPVEPARNPRRHLAGPPTRPMSGVHRSGHEAPRPGRARTRDQARRHPPHHHGADGGPGDEVGRDRRDGHRTERGQQERCDSELG